MISNNQRVKRAQIIDAAKEVLATQGLAACTARAVADASPLTKSAIHYYFDDIDEIVDEAMAGHVDAMLTNLRRVADAHADPGERLWRVVEAYLATFAEQPDAAFLWFEYWMAASRRDALDRPAAMLHRMRELFTRLLTVPSPEATAQELLSWLLGTIVQQHVRPRPLDELRPEIARFVS